MPRRSLPVALLLGAIYLLGAAGIVIGLAQSRQRAIDQMSTSEEQARWQKWKTDAAQQDGTTGPVQRRPPKSDEPPMLVLMRDHYVVIVIASLTFYTFLFGLSVFLVRGLVGQSFLSARRGK
jgi:hypothetical protein